MPNTISVAQRSQFWQASRPWLVVGISSLVLLILRFVGFEPQLRGILESTLQPLSLAAAQVTQLVQTPLVTFTNTRKLQYRVRDIEVRYAELLSQVSEADQLRAENEALRSMIENTDRELVPTIITAPITAYGTTYVAAGEVAGVTPGDPVVLGNIILGTIKEVSPMQAKVSLVSQPLNKPLLVQTQSGVTGLIQGDGRRILLTEVSSEDDLKEDEVVTTVGQPGIPPNLVVGQIVAIIDQLSASSQVAVLDQGISFFDTSLVEIRPQQ